MQDQNCPAVHVYQQVLGAAINTFHLAPLDPAPELCPGHGQPKPAIAEHHAVNRAAYKTGNQTTADCFNLR